MNKSLETLQKRGFLKQCTDLERLSSYLDNNSVRFYCGTDPTGPSLHIGHIVPLFAMHHLQKDGHRPIVLVGDGTATIGDPSGKTEMRKMLSFEQIQDNAKAISKQIGRIIDLSDKSSAIIRYNSKWLMDLNYIRFLRDIGKHFSVNRMLTFESYKQRLERGLSFIEFNYQLLQSYDFLKLYQDEECKLQIGGDDQWGNIVAGIDLIRRKEKKEDAFGLTFNLITRADGKKMGKSEKGAVFLDKNLFSCYDFFQYWRNVCDDDVFRFMKMFTFMELDEIREYEEGNKYTINQAKEKLAYEQTKIIHGKKEADKALEAARALFTGSSDAKGIPSVTVDKSKLADGLSVIELFALTELCKSNGEARRLIQQGGARINEEKVVDINAKVYEKDLDKDQLILKAGKKRFFKVVFK